MAQAKQRVHHQNKCKAVKGHFRTDDLTCFYTGIKLRTKAHDVQALKASIEHLVPQNSKTQASLGFRKNMVPCANQINAMVGNAPLVVKYALKEFFKGFAFHPTLSDKDLGKTIKAATTIFLGPYKNHGHYVWAWNAYQGKKNISDNLRLVRKRELYDAYMLLLTEEEIAIEAYTKWDLEEKA